MIWLVVNSTTEPIEQNNFAIELDMYGRFLDCYVDHPILLNFWNKISIEFREGEIITSANGQWHTIAMDGVSETDDISVSFQDWTLGDAERGISGVLDAFEVYRPYSDAIPSKALPVYIWAIVGVVIIGIIFFIYCFIYPRYCKRSTRADKTFEGVEFNSYTAENKPIPTIPTIAPPASTNGQAAFGQTAIKRPQRPMSTPAMTPPKPRGAPPIPGALPPQPIGVPPPRPNMTPPKPDFAPPRPIGKTSGRRAPPRPTNRTNSTGSRTSGNVLNLGLSPQERRESWKV